jgi:transposase
LFFTSQIVVNGNATQAEIVKAFGVSSISAKRWVNRYRTEGARGFFFSSRQRTNTVLTAETVSRIQHLYLTGLSLEEISPMVGVKTDTIKKAVCQWWLLLGEPDDGELVPATKSLRQRIALFCQRAQIFSNGLTNLTGIG